MKYALFIFALFIMASLSFGCGGDHPDDTGGWPPPVDCFNVNHTVDCGDYSVSFCQAWSEVVPVREDYFLVEHEGVTTVFPVVESIDDTLATVAEWCEQH